MEVKAIELIALVIAIVIGLITGYIVGRKNK